MLSDHYHALQHVSLQEAQINLSRLDLSRDHRIRYVCQIIEAHAYKIFRDKPSALCNQLRSGIFPELFELLAREQRLKQIGCFCPDEDAGELRQGGFPALQDAINDWPVATLVAEVRHELQRICDRGGASTREPIYTGDWWSINLFDSTLPSGCPAASLFPKTLDLLLNTQAMKKSLKIVQAKPESTPPLIARLSCLGPRSRIEPHFGMNLWKTRVHLPIRVPDSKCFILAGYEQREWQEGAPIFLDDTYLHAVANESDAVRIVLIIDIIHPSANHTKVRGYE